MTAQAKNYAEETVTGAKWKRANRVTILNPYGGDASVAYDEEQITEIGDQIAASPTRTLSTKFDPGVLIDLIDPVTLEPMGSQVPMSYVYVAIASLYWKLAADADAQQT